MDSDKNVDLGEWKLIITMLCIVIAILMFIVTLPFAEKMKESLNSSSTQESGQVSTEETANKSEISN